MFGISAFFMQKLRLQIFFCLSGMHAAEQDAPAGGRLETLLQEVNRPGRV